MRHAPEVHAAEIEPAPLDSKGRCSPMSHACEWCRGRARLHGRSRTDVESSPRWTRPSPHLHCHCDSVVKELRAAVLPWGRPDSNRVGLSMTTGLRPASVALPSTSPCFCNGAASGIRTRVLGMASRDPSAGRRPRTHVEPPAGIEPATSGLRNRRCFQLSYGGNGTPPRIRTSPWEFWRLPLAQPARCTCLGALPPVAKMKRAGNLSVPGPRKCP